jgi:hypothetical protein
MPWLTPVAFKRARYEPLTELGMRSRQDFLLELRYFVRKCARGRGGTLFGELQGGDSTSGPPFIFTEVSGSEVSSSHIRSFRCPKKL